MLDPNQRSLMTSLLTPPPGMVYDMGLATTFSLDPLTLLGLPVHLAWMASHGETGHLADPIRLLESLQRVSKRLTVFADRGRMLVPGQANALFALLEGTIAEVRAPQGGAFHPKLWVLKFKNPNDVNRPVLRVGILSRNLTSDRSWDLSLVMEGEVHGAFQAANKPLGELIAQLPEWAVTPLSTARRTQVEQLADDLRKTSLAPPPPWQSLSFHVLGLKRGPWSAFEGDADEIAVISPFLTPLALERVAATAGKRLTLISRPETLAALPVQTRLKFDSCKTLDDAAETEDGEAAERRDTLGLHAKAVLLRRGWETHLFVGSANITTAAVEKCLNVEVVVELQGKHSKVGRVEQLLDKADLGGVLEEFDPATAPEADDEESALAKQGLEDCRRAIAAASFSVSCVKQDEASWNLILTPKRAVDLGKAEVAVWPLSLPIETNTSGKPLASGESVELANVDAADITGLVGFELKIGEFTLRFALNMPLKGLPDEREGAILRRVIRNREGFVRYLKLLLGGLVASPDRDDSDFAAAKGSPWTAGASGLESLLEDLVRVFSREPERLKDVAQVVARLRAPTADEGSVIPPEFDELWAVFDQSLRAKR